MQANALLKNRFQLEQKRLSHSDALYKNPKFHK